MWELWAGGWGETGSLNVLEGGEKDTNNLLSCIHYALKGFPAGRVAGTIPHSDAARQNALDGASFEGAHDGGRDSGSSQFAEEVEMLLCFLGQCCSVVSPEEVLCDVHTQELRAAHSLQSRTFDGQRNMMIVHSSEVNNKRARAPAPIMCTFYRGTIESILTSCITVWYGSCNASCRKTLQSIVRAAEKIIGVSLPSLQDIYGTRLTHKALCIAGDPTHPSHSLCSLLPSGRRLWSLQAKTSRLKDSFIHQAVR
uniref:Uncharacterized protein n=1 Tax=Cyprinus carpio carpio TaxID=630221 RepID=A0A9J7ZV02_CYPCA